MSLLIIILKLMIYPVVISLVVKIGKFTGFWKGWIFITIGMALTLVSVIFQLVDYFAFLDAGLYITLCPLVSVSCMGLGFYYILGEVKSVDRGHGRRGK